MSRSRITAAGALAALLTGLAVAPAPHVHAEDVLGETDPCLGRPPPLRVGAPASTFESPHHAWTSSDGADSLYVEDGRLIISDISEDWLWLTASSDFHGDWERIDRIELRIKADAESRSEHPAIVELSNGESTATFTLHKRFLTPGVWCDVSIPMTPALWTSKRPLRDVTSSVTRMRLRLDLDGRTDAQEEHLVDHVRLVPRAFSDFIDGSDGWTASNGRLDEDDGHVVVRDTGRGWCWLRAPRAFHGDLRRYRALELRLCVDVDRAPDQPLRVQLESGDRLAFHQIAPKEIGLREWRTLEIPLDGSTWAKVGTWDTLLADVTDLYLRVDLVDGRGEDEIVRISTVRLIPR